MIPDGRWMNQSRHTINAIRISEQESLAKVELKAREDVLVQPARFLLAELRDDLVEIIRLHINGASMLELSPTVTPGAPHCPDYGQTHITRTKDVHPWLRATHLSQPSHIRVHNSHQPSDRDCYYSVPNSDPIVAIN